MGSFQQVLLGASCLVAAFLFGSYLHNRPAENQQIDDSQIAVADPLDSLFSFDKKPRATNRPTVSGFQQTPTMAQSPAAPGNSSIDSSERMPVVVASNEQIEEQSSARQSAVPAAARKPVVPDFSELASRFRNTPLELAEQSPQHSAADSVHESERVPASNLFGAPKLIVRQPENAQPLREVTSEVDRIEETIRGEFSAVQPETTRWRVNRSKALQQFRGPNQIPQQDTGPQETIEDVLARRSADYLKNEESNRETWATNPPQDNWTSARRREVTEQAAMRNQQSLEVEDPGNRFRSVMSQPEDMAPPEPDFETAYYRPSDQRQDSVPPQPSGNLRPVKKGASNVIRQSNIQSQFGNTYEIQAGDTLQSISMRFYGSADGYLELYKANREVLDRITSSPAGVVIEIPNLNN